MANPPQLTTMGCRLNAYESAAMQELAQEAGLTDVIIVNSCAVTQEAVRQTKQTIRRHRREQPQARIIVTGCAAQIDPESFSAMAEVDHVLGNREKMERQSWQALAADFIGASEAPMVDDIMAVRETAGHLIDGFGTRARAYVQVQNGCDHRCTFCIIPYGRGNSRSVPAGVVVDQIRRLRDQGFNEIVLTGVDMTSWGEDLPGKPPLGDLVQRILKLVPDLPRLRISSIDSIEADAALIAAAQSDPRFMPHLHLSLQAGDNLILKRMKRRHSREDAIALCAQLRKARPEFVFGADIIAGFPTEDEAMFARSLDLVEECDLTWLHVFPYSPRPGTPAARMPQLPRQLIKARAAQLREAGEAAKARYLKGQIGSQARVLLENATMGRTEAFAEVYFQAPHPESATGQIIDAQITGANTQGLLA